MHLHLHPTLLLPFLALPTPLLATTQPPSSPLKTATLHHTPDSPTPLALLTYSPKPPHHATLASFTPPLNTSDTTALTSVLVYLHSNSDDGRGPTRYRSTVTATYGFHAPYRGRFRVVLDKAGDVMGASWHSYLVKGGSSSSAVVAGKGKGKGEDSENGKGDFDILTTKSAPSVVFDKGVKGKVGGAGAGTGAGVAGKEGEEEEVVEKTFLQKYWWVLLGVAVLAMTGGGDK